ncbi:MAG: choice-of-anchor Q domain-containing protein [Candidatus Acidiferrales bacterium]
MGAGGAIYVQGGGLGIQFSTFDGNGAVGGNGSGFDRAAGGGGGGLSGNGGNAGIDSAPCCTDYVGGGGGGGSRGDGGTGGGLGGGGGGTVTDGFSPDISSGLTDGGFNCGGFGGTGSGVPFSDNDGHSGFCPGGGGGGGVSASAAIIGVSGNGGNGNYGGGGGGAGGGAFSNADGGFGGFGGGGGGGAGGTGNGGNGGFGGGGAGGLGGAGQGGVTGDIRDGNGGNGDPYYGGGGGGALGGAIFNHGGTVNIKDSTFTANFVIRGLGSGGVSGTGQDAGGAIFSLDGSLTVIDSTISGNRSTGFNGGITVIILGISPPVPDAAFVLDDTIIAGNGLDECTFFSLNPMTPVGAGNLIENNNNNFSPFCPGVVETADPQLGPLQDNGGFTPTMAISTTSPAWNTADAATSLGSDQRGQVRPAMNGLFDIGAFELCEIIDHLLIRPCPPIEFQVQETEPLTILISPPAGGSTTPPAGLNNEPLGSVTPLTATPNPGYTFQNWLGNVTNPSSASTTIVMDEPQTVTANFVACTCAMDVSTSIGVIGSGFVLNIGTGRIAQTVTLTNNSTMTIAGPFSLVLDGLSANATLFNATGTTSTLFPPAGSPYINATATLAPGQKIVIALQFNDPTKTAISYTTRVLAGPGSR